MKLLAWDSSSRIGTIVAIEWNPSLCTSWAEVQVIAEFSFNMQAHTSECLLWGIHQVLEAAHWKIKEVDVFGIGIGPGSFTGLRIGITTVRTIADLLKKPIVKISSLAALARPIALHFQPSLFSRIKKTWMIINRNAYQGECFALWGLSQDILTCIQPKFWHPRVQEVVTTLEKLMHTLNNEIHAKSLIPENTFEETAWFVLNPFEKQKGELWKSLPQAQRQWIPFENQEHVQGRYLGQLAWEAVQADLLESAHTVFPNYLRASYAEEKNTNR